MMWTRGRECLIWLLLMHASAFEARGKGPFGRLGALRSNADGNASPPEPAVPIEMDEEDAANEKSQLKFKAEISAFTNPLPLVSQNKLDEIFRKPENWNLFLTAGGKRPSEEIPVSPTLMDDWILACRKVGAHPPSAEDDCIMSVQTGGIKFPGLELRSLTQIGVKFIEQKSLYEFVLIGADRTVKGLPPVVWLYNKLTGGDGENTHDTSSQTSLSTVGYTVHEDSVVFGVNGSISIGVKFPAFLLKMLPMNREKAEETGGKAVAKAVIKDVEASIKAFEEVYLSSIE